MKPKSIKFAGMTIHEANNRLLFQLYHHYSGAEAANIADLVMEKITGWKRIDRVLNKQVKLSAPAEALLEKHIEGLAAHQPVQYVLGEAWFYNMKFFVSSQVLIPRPETEELVEWVLSSIAKDSGKTIIDIGTGSGCIAVALKKGLPNAMVYACDVSEGALEVAATNALMHETAILFSKTDILDHGQWNTLPKANVIVSNPPYIPADEKALMSPHVVLHEPHDALFVNTTDPLVFYRAIAGFAAQRLLPDGWVYAEVHEDLAVETAGIFEPSVFADVEIRKDMQGKNRMIRARAHSTNARNARDD